MAALSALGQAITVAVFAPKSISTLSTPSTLSSAACTRGGQPRGQVIPLLMASVTGWATCKCVKPGIIDFS